MPSVYPMLFFDKSPFYIINSDIVVIFLCREINLNKVLLLGYEIMNLVMHTTNAKVTLVGVYIFSILCDI